MKQSGLALGPNKGRSKRVRVRGLALIEMLVVFVLVALLSVLIVQGLGFFLANYQAVDRARSDAATASLQRGWFVDTVRGMVAARHRDRRFQGSRDAFEGLTLQALAVESGVPAKVRWSVRETEDATTLAYQEVDRGGAADGETDDVDWVVLTRQGDDAELAFQYADRAGNWQDEWPLGPLGDYLPRAVRLIAETGETVWFVQVDMHFQPIVPDEEFL